MEVRVHDSRPPLTGKCNYASDGHVTRGVLAALVPMLCSDTLTAHARPHRRGVCEKVGACLQTAARVCCSWPWVFILFGRSVDPEAYFLVQSRLHGLGLDFIPVAAQHSDALSLDFGFRGCTSTEQSVIGGCAHLLNFTGLCACPCVCLSASLDWYLRCDCGLQAVTRCLRATMLSLS